MSSSEAGNAILHQGPAVQGYQQYVVNTQQLAHCVMELLQNGEFAK